MNIKGQISKLFHKKREIILAPNHALVSQVAREQALINNWLALKQASLKIRGSPI